MTTWLRTLFLLFFTLGAQSELHAQSVPPLDAKALRERAERLLWWGDFEALERLLAKAQVEPRLSPNGNTALSIFNNAPSYLGNRSGRHRAYLEERLRLTRAWRAQYPESPLALRLEAEALIGLAWYERGGGYANTVSEEGQKAFLQHIEAARDLLLSNPKLLEGSGQAYLPLLVVGRALSWPTGTMLKLVETGHRQNPQDLHIFEVAMPAFTPRWGGGRADVEALVRLAMNLTPERALETYAVLYIMAANEHYKQTLFTESHARWPLLRDGLQARMLRTPNGNWARNQLAVMACLAKDLGTYQKAMDDLTANGGAPDLEDWNYLGGQRMLDQCQRWGARS